MALLGTLGKLANNAFNSVFKPSLVGLNTMQAPFNGGQMTSLPRLGSNTNTYPGSGMVSPSFNMQNSGTGISQLPKNTGLVGLDGQPVAVPDFAPNDQLPTQQDILNPGHTGNWLTQALNPWMMTGGGGPLTPQQPAQQPQQPQQPQPGLTVPPGQQAPDIQSFAPTTQSITQSAGGPTGGFNTGFGASAGGFFNSNSLLGALLAALQGQQMGAGGFGGDGGIDPITGKKKKKKTIAQRHNNPGNLVYAGQSGAAPGEAKDGSLAWAKFDSPDAGFAALGADIGAKLARKPDMTLQELIATRSPGNENNLATLVPQISASLGVKPDSKVSKMDTNQLMNVLARFEGFYQQ